MSSELEQATRMWYAAPDYLRLTLNAPDTAQVGLDPYRMAALRVGHQEVSSWVEAEPWAWLGYYGQRIGKASWGQSAQGAILQVTGSAAEGVIGLSLPYSNVPRLDIQVTVWLSHDMPDVAAQVAETSDTARRGRGGRSWAVQHIRGYGSGDTCYLGRRTSDVYCRVYDKWRESGNEEYRHSWRYEVELKGAAAASVWKVEAGIATKPEYWAGHVVKAFKSRGVVLPLPVEAAASEAPVREDEQTVIERRLAWYRNQVAPSIERLQSRGVALDAIIEALGIDRRGAAR